MDHDGIASDTTNGMWEPPGYESTSGVADDGDTGTSGYDGGGEYGAPEDSTGTGDSSDDGTGSDTGTGGEASGSGTMTVEVEGQTRELPAEKDYTGDGRPDAAAETSDGKVIIFADTEDNTTGEAGPDGKADEAYVVDKSTGRVVGAAHIDPDSGEWVEGVDTDGPGAVPSDSTGGGTGTGTGTGTETGGGTETGTETGGGTTTTGSGSDGPDIVTVESGGHEIGVVETLDTDGDGQPDSGVIYADGRAIVVTNTDDDPEAEQVAVVDPETGQVVDVAHVNPETGEWEEGPAPGYGEGSTGGGSTDGGSTDGGSTDGGSTDGGSTDGGSTGAGSTDGGYEGGGTDGGTDGAETGTTTGSGTMIVDVDGQTRELPAEKDYTGDGRPDASAETSDGKVIIFADTEDNTTGEAGPDGKADEAYVVDKSTGKVVGAAHVDPKTGEWVDGVDTDGAAAVPSSAGQGS